MKNRVLIISFIIILVGFVIFGTIYLYKQITRVDESEKMNNDNQVNVYRKKETVNLLSDVELFLFTKKDVKLSYEGGPSHWGSRTITFDNTYMKGNDKVVNLHIVDESDLKGDSPKKEWNQKWAATTDGLLYIDDVLMLKSPIVVGQSWTINDYVPVAVSDKKYTANIKITNVQSSLDDSNSEVKKVCTTLTIDDIRTVDGGIYTETRVFESSVGLKEFSATEPTISELKLNYWLDSKINIQ